MKKTINVDRQSKTAKSNTVNKKVAKNVPQTRDIFYFRQNPVPDDYLNVLAKEYVTWACDNDEAYKASQFRTLKKILGSTWMSWLARSETLMEAHLFVLQVIGDRREIGALTKKLDSSIVSSMMPYYDPEWKKLVEWHSSLREKEKKQETSNFITLNPSFGKLETISKEIKNVENH